MVGEGGCCGVVVVKLDESIGEAIFRTRTLLSNLFKTTSRRLTTLRKSALTLSRLSPLLSTSASKPFTNSAILTKTNSQSNAPPAPAPRPSTARRHRPAPPLPLLRLQQAQANNPLVEQDPQAARPYPGRYLGLSAEGIEPVQLSAGARTGWDCVEVRGDFEKVQGVQGAD